MSSEVYQTSPEPDRDISRLGFGFMQTVDAEPQHEPQTVVDPVAAYLKTLTHPLIDAEREKELGKIIEAGVYAEHLLDTDDDAVVAMAEHHSISTDELIVDLRQLATMADDARQELVNANLRFVVKLAKGYVGRGHDLDLLELIQEGNMGMMHAAMKFDYTKDNKFITYASWWIRRYIGIAIENHGSQISLSKGARQKIRNMNVVREQFVTVNGRKPSIEELASELGITVGEARLIEEYDIRIVSLNTPIDETRELGDVLSGDDDSQLGRVLRSDAQLAIDRYMRIYLTELEEQLVREYVMASPSKGRPSHADIATQYGISINMVSVRLKSALGKLRKAMADDPGIHDALEELSA